MPSRTAGWLGLGALALGFGFLYAPIALLVLYSFNASRLVTVWAGFSTHWYDALLHDEAFGAAAMTSLEVAAMAATLSFVLGTCAGVSMARFARFPGRLLFGFALLAPLVVPEVILGLSLLLLFVACESWFGWPSRGMLTITIAHATFGACFVSVLVHAQLAGFDRALEEAALDLGARPWTVLMRITLPGISRPWYRAGSWRSHCRSTIWWSPVLSPARPRRPYRWRYFRACASG
jgi:putrescine transport system permease protein